MLECTRYRFFYPTYIRTGTFSLVTYETNPRNTSVLFAPHSINSINTCFFFLFSLPRSYA